MTAQEQEMIQGLAARINQTVLSDKDPQAEQFLQQSLGHNPDAMYILAQTVLVQQYALDQAKKQLDDLRQQAAPPQPEKHSSFLGNLLGMNDQPNRQPPPPPPPTQYAPVNYGGQPQFGQPQYAQPAYGQPQYGQPQQGGGFLHGAMQTAAGVAAGALAFEGIESLMHGFGGGGGRQSGFGEFGGGGGREEVVNNYYGDSDRGGISRDIEDRRDASTNYDTSLADNDPDDFSNVSDDSASTDTSLADNDPDDFSSSSDDSNS